MEFSEIGEKLGGLDADQVLTLAEFGKGVLENGVWFLSTGFTSLVSEMMSEDQIDLDKNRYVIMTLLGIANQANELLNECWQQKKTILGLTGVVSDDERFCLKGAKNIKLS